MKRTILFFSAAALISLSGTLTSCGGGGHNHEGHDHGTEAHDHGAEETASYACPMKCEGEKTYAEAGECPTCGMALEEVAEVSHDGHDHGAGGHGHEGHSH